MSDINTPPPPPPEERVVHQTTINTAPERKSGGSWLAFLVGGLLVVVALIGWAVYSGQTPVVTEPAEVNVDIDLPRPTMPDTPKLPDRPALPDVQPPTAEASAPAN